jgi:parallel beta-helix repeat protein
MRMLFGILGFAGFLAVAPAAEYHVSPSGSDFQAGDGAHPFQTIGKAVSVVVAGDTIWLHTGVYREGVHVTTQGKTSLTIAAAPGEKPQIFGSEALMGPWEDAGEGIFRTSLPTKPQAAGWLFIDDQPGALNLGKKPQKPGEFVLEGTHILVQLKPGDRPEKAHFEWATRSSVVVIDSGACPTHLQDLDLAFAANSAQEGMVFLSPGSVIENCVVRDSLSRGISVPEYGTVERCHVFNHGILGIGSAGDGAEGVRGIRILDNEVNANSWYKADTGWEAGGVKLSQIRDSVVRGNNIHDNLAWGIWLDWQCTGNRLEANTCRHNVAAGIFLEASKGRNIIANNICIENRRDLHNDWGDGIFSHESSDALVAHNLCFHNECFGIRFRLEADRKMADGRMFECARNVIVNNICADNAIGQLQLPSDAPRQHDNVSDGNILFTDLPGAHTAQAFYSSSLLDFVSWRKLGFDAHSLEAKPLFRDGDKGDFHPAAKNPQAGIDPYLVEVPVDFDGHPRNYLATTAGPFEFVP